MQIDENLINKMGRRMNCLKHLKLSQCQINVDPFVDSIADVFGQQPISLILDKTAYHPYMRKFIENESSKLEHLSLYLNHNYFAGTLTTKLPNNLKSFSLRGHQNVDSLPILNMARDCNNLKILQFEIKTLLPNIEAIGNIKSLVYLNLAFNSIVNEDALQNVISRELPNLKALNIDGYCSTKTMSKICQALPDLVHLNVFAQNAFQIPDSLNSLTLRISANSGLFLPTLLFEQTNKSIQHLDIRSQLVSFFPNFIEELLDKFKDLKTIHCKLPATNAQIYSLFSLMRDHLKKGRKITIYLHFQDRQYNPLYYKYILPDDLPQFETGWRAKSSNGKCENLVLKKLIKEVIDGGDQQPSFLDDWWMD